MTDLVIIVVVAVILAAAGAYIYREKKKGAKCIGCPMSGSCARKQSGCEKGADGSFHTE